MSKRKNPSGADNLNGDFCEFLMELAEYEKNVSRNIHKHNAYRKAASVLALHHKRIESGDEAKKLNGIGDKISKKIDEFLQTGKLQKLENINQDEETQAISLLTRVSGIGPVKAAELVRSGIKTIEDLRRNQDKLNHHQLIGLKYFEDFEKKIPRSEIQDIEKELKEKILALDPQFTVTICGSYRRGKQESGDIDALLAHPAAPEAGGARGGGGPGGRGARGGRLLRAAVAALGGLVVDTISIGDTKFMGVCRRGGGGGGGAAGAGRAGGAAQRLDARLVARARLPCALLHYTGSDEFNKTLRAHALQHGFTLNEYALRPIGVTGVPGAPVPLASEDEVFDYIGYPYKAPEERNL